MPTPTDLVTDLPADFEVFGQAVDTSMADLKGGTTGQILSKATNTDMDFTWITNDVGDITNIAVTSPITGGGSSGSVTIGVSAASTAAAGVVQLSDSTSTTSSVLAATPTAVKAAYDKASTAATTSVAGIVQLSDSTSTTSSVLASTPTATKSAYDLAAAAIPKSTVTTAGDVIYATGSSAVTRLGVGTTGQVLTVAAGVPSWATPAGGSTFAGCRLVPNTGQAISNATFTALVYQTETFDVGGYHSTVTNTSRITVPSGKAGYYAITAATFWPSDSSGVRQIQLQVNGTTDIGRTVITGTAGGVVSELYTDVYYLNVGDYVQSLVYQNSGSTLTTQTGYDGNYFAVSFLGA